MTDRADELLKLARQHFGKLTQAETKLFNAVAKGEPAVYLAKDPTKDDPALGDQWGKPRTLLADRIEWLCTDREASQFVGHKGIQIIGAKIEGHLDLMFARIAFPIVLLSCRVLEPMNFIHSKVGGLFFNGSHIAGLEADSLSAEGSINLGDGFRAEGAVRLLGASIGGNLDCSKGRFQNPKGEALTADRLKVYGSVNLGDGFHSKGEVRLLKASIGGSLNCSKGLFHNPKGVALGADSLKVEGSVNLRDAFRAEGAVRLLGASIGGNLDCSGGHFQNPGSNTLNLEIAEIAGHVFLREGLDNEGKMVKPFISGRVSFIRADLKGGFQWRDITTPKDVILDLEHSHIGVLFDEPGSWLPSGNLFLDGCTYDRIEGLQPGDSKPRIEWVKRSQPRHFTPQPYEQLAKVFRENGFEEDARDVLIAKNKSYIKNAPVSRWAKLRRRIFGLILGYGYRPWKAVWWLLSFWGIGTGLFWLGRYVEVIQPTRSVPYPDFIAPVYSLDLFIPLINLHQATYWLPDSQNLWGILILIYFCVHIVLGWVLMTMFIFGLTGLLKR